MSQKPIFGDEGVVFGIKTVHFSISSHTFGAEWDELDGIEKQKYKVHVSMFPPHLMAKNDKSDKDWKHN